MKKLLIIISFAAINCKDILERCPGGFRNKSGGKSKFSPAAAGNTTPIITH